MSTFVIEHNYKGNYVMETIAGVEDIDTSAYENLLGIWVCENQEEVKAVETELKRIRNARSSQQA